MEDYRRKYHYFGNTGGSIDQEYLYFTFYRYVHMLALSLIIAKSDLNFCASLMIIAPAQSRGKTAGGRDSRSGPPAYQSPLCPTFLCHSQNMIISITLYLGCFPFFLGLTKGNCVEDFKFKSCSTLVSTSPV